MRIVFYCQHVLGVGHMFRSLEIVKALKDHEVILVTGGAHVDFDPPANMTRIQLPGLMMDAKFTRFIPLEEGAEVDDVLVRRLRQFKEIMAEYRPDIFMVELFPFGRKKFRFELLPILKKVRKGEYGKCKSVCSVRDILVEKKDMQRQVERVHGYLNPNFDHVLVHSDPNLVRLDETFPGVEGIVPEVHYTGYVARKPNPAETEQLAAELNLGETPLVVASVGGGHIGRDLLRGVMAASPILNETHPHRLALFTGPYAEEDEFERLREEAKAHPHITVKRFTKRFLAYLDLARLSVSLGGYNTTMNLLATNTFGLMYPFLQNREQNMRARRIEEKGGLKVITQDDLGPERLVPLMREGLDRRAEPLHLDLDGGPNSARILEEILASM
ncbi:glycosyltransferase [uncultured Pseudodesulfovibrio sp.]|uniref:glycosyltransferase family protein n=1 Tax=uncultured Pseudodesulfovibrio sp. TaxID=2035858 RepID=UPI0029C63FD7|nr:glycosyltransferase [uncultured Pseudodesulfovibrio sp.]